MRRTLIGLVTLALLGTFAPTSARAAEGGLFAVDVSRATAAELRALEWSASSGNWVELGDLLVVQAERRAIVRLAGSLPLRELDRPRNGERLYVTTHVHPNELAISRPAGCEARLVASSGVYAVVATTEAGADLIQSDLLRAAEPATIDVFVPSRVYARAGAAAPRRVAKTAGASTAADAVDAERWLATAKDLADFKTRLTGSDGANMARDYVASTFADLGLTVAEPQFPVGAVKGYDVVGELRGTTRPNDVYVVCGHYDSISEQPQTLAPGAEDNGSGAAGVVELARVFAANRPASTVRFIVFSGEEEGLYGSRFYVDRLKASGEAGRVKGVVNMDMIGYSGDEDLDVLLETSDVGADLQDRLAEAAATYTSLRVVRSLHPFGSDHVPFLRAGIPCVLTIENDWDEYAPYHTSRDTIENVRRDMGGQILRMNAATISALANAEDVPTEPTVTASVPFPTGDRTVFGGFSQDVEWTVDGGEPTSFAVDVSRNGGASFDEHHGVSDPAARSLNFVFEPSDKVRSVVYRVSATMADGSVVTGIAEPFRVKPSVGPKLQKVIFGRGNGDDSFVLAGRFAAEAVRVEVNGVALDEETVVPSGFRGNTCRGIDVSLVDLDELFPRGVAVEVRVVDTRFGTAASARVTR